MTFKTKHDIVKITNEDFEGMEDEFSFTVKILSQKDIIDISLSLDNKTKNKGSDIELAKLIFIEGIKDWSGIVDEDGSILKPTKKNIEAIYDFEPLFCSSVYEKAESKINEVKKKSVKD